VHDYFDILGLPVDAPASEVRRACARRVHRAHPDFRARSSAILAAVVADWPSHESVSSDVAIDFVDVAPLVERMQAAFFGTED